MKYKVGDRVKIKSLDWYNENKDEYGYIDCGSRAFFTKMSDWCGKIATIKEICKTNCYHLEEYDFDWTDEMIEGLVEEKFGTALNPLELKSNANCITQERVDELDTKIDEELPYDNPYEWECPEGYIFKDENGNVINATKIVLEKVNTLKTQSNNMETETHRGYCTTEEETTNESKKVAWFTFEDNDFADKVELALLNRELIQEDGKWFVVKKKKEYPKTYEECCKVLEIEGDSLLINTKHITDYERYLGNLMGQLHRLIICRDAYWKIAGEEMGLGKPWSPSDNNKKPIHAITRYDGYIIKDESGGNDEVLEFPTPEMRDAFYENFKSEIESCKELL